MQRRAKPSKIRYCRVDDLAKSGKTLHPFANSVLQNCYMATITKRGKRWTAQIRRQGFEPKSATFATKGEAAAWATRTEAEMLQGNHAASTRKTLKDAMLRYMEEVVPTKRGHVKRLQNCNTLLKRLPFLDYRLGSITTPMVAEWRDSLLQEVKPGTVIAYLGLLNCVMEIARREWQWIKDNPVKDVRNPPTPKHREVIYSDEDIAAVCAELPQTARDVFMVAIETGMRRGEILGLEWDIIHLDQAFLRLQTTKNGHSRDVPLSGIALGILRRRRDFERPFDINAECFRQQFEAALKRAGLVGYRFHDARHTAVTRLAKKLDVMTLARMIGHKDLRSLMIYYNRSASDIAKLL